MGGLGDGYFFFGAGGVLVILRSKKKCSRLRVLDEICVGKFREACVEWKIFGACGCIDR